MWGRKPCGDKPGGHDPLRGSMSDPSPKPLPKPLPEAAARALAEAEERRARAERDAAGSDGRKELNGPKGPEPVRYGDWERNGLASDF
jgi:hypothetical protein